eukprot:m.58461 g.58461  ORF g.58461 m.58461 type:complete len:968 (+) comp34815_c0_seq4:211-3114(+)
MASDGKGAPKPFSADLFGSTPAGLSGFSLTSDSKSPIPFIVPQDSLGGATKKEKEELAPFGSPEQTERPGSTSMTQVDLSDDGPMEELAVSSAKQSEKSRNQPPVGMSQSPDIRPVFGAPPVASAAELGFERENPTLSSQFTSSPALSAASLQLDTTQPSLPPPSATGMTTAPPGAASPTPYNPYRAHQFQQPTQAHYRPPPSPSQHQYIPVAQPYPPTAVPSHHGNHHHGDHHCDDHHDGHSHSHGHAHSHGPSHLAPGPPPMQAAIEATVRPYWFYLSRKGYWTPFSITDSNSLEMAHSSGVGSIVTTDGGRYDVHLSRRRRSAIYWMEAETEVRRTTWFYKGEEDRYYVPYKEETADKLEAEYQSSLQSRVWNKWVDLGDGSTVAFHNPSVIVQHVVPAGSSSGVPVQSTGGSEQQTKPRLVKRGFDEVDQLDQGEFPVIEHLVFIVHGLAPAADDRHQSVIDTVDDFRLVAEALLHAHQLPNRSPGGRVEFLPVLWQSALGDDPRFINDRLKDVSLASISRLRDFSNHSLIDLLFYTSPVYFEKIISFVPNDINRMLALFMTRNPGFTGTVSVMGHSLGSCILFDILSHQLPGQLGQSAETQPEEQPAAEAEAPLEEEEIPSLPSLSEGLEQLGLTDFLSKFEAEQMDMESLIMCSGDDLKEMDIPMGPRKKLLGFIKQQLGMKEEINRKKDEAKARAELKAQLEQEEEARHIAAEQAALLVDNPIKEFKCQKIGVGIGNLLVDYPQLDFQPAHLFACGSPIAFFLSIRSDEGALGPSYQLPSCPAVFNIFHPCDPMAYRLEPLIEASPPPKPVLMPHHKGRKRFHLELKDNLVNMGTNLKRQIIKGVRQTWQTLNEFARSHYSGASEGLSGGEPEEETKDRPESTSEEIPSTVENVSVGILNGGRRIDYVLQEKVIESFNEYLFAFSSHFSYWQSEDTALMILKEVYGAELMSTTVQVSTDP